MAAGGEGALCGIVSAQPPPRPRLLQDPPLPKSLSGHFPAHRPLVTLCIRYEEIDLETGILETKRDPIPLDDIYPVHMVVDNSDGIQGSCQDFKERLDITAQIRTEDMHSRCTYVEAHEK